MAMIDYGVIVIKNGKLVEDTKGGDYSVRNGVGGEFLHKPRGLHFYRMSIKDHENIDKADEVVQLYSEISAKRKKVLYPTVNGLAMKTKEIYPQTYLTTFKDDNGDRYKVIQGYDVGFTNFYSKQREKVIKKYIN